MPLTVGSQREKRSPPKTRPRNRAKLEKVTSQPVTTFYPSERLTHCNRPGLAQTRAGGLEHAWTVSALSEGLVHEKPRVRGAQAAALGNTRMWPHQPPGSGGAGVGGPSSPLRTLKGWHSTYWIRSGEAPRPQDELSTNVLRSKVHGALSPPEIQTENSTKQNECRKTQQGLDLLHEIISIVSSEMSTRNYFPVLGAVGGSWGCFLRALECTCLLVNSAPRTECSLSLMDAPDALPSSGHCPCCHPGLFGKDF